jgi:hypothetical protein
MRWRVRHRRFKPKNGGFGVPSFVLKRRASVDETDNYVSAGAL